MRNSGSTSLAQLVARAPDDDVRSAAAADFEAGVARTACIVQQLLTLARVQPSVADGRAWLEMADTGLGIPEAERVRVFDRFYRGEGTVETGSGLGLAIVKAIADRHHAEIRLSDTPGGGLTVRVLLLISSGGRNLTK